MASALMHDAREGSMAAALAAVDRLGNSLKAAVSHAQLVQSNIIQEATRTDAFSIAELEQEARAMRAAVMLRMAKSMIAAIDNWFDRRAQRQLEEYLAASQNLSDLEARMRRYTDKGSPFVPAQGHYD